MVCASECGRTDVEKRDEETPLFTSPPCSDADAHTRAHTHKHILKKAREPQQLERNENTQKDADGGDRKEMSGNQVSLFTHNKAHLFTGGTECAYIQRHRLSPTTTARKARDSAPKTHRKKHEKKAMLMEDNETERQRVSERCRVVRKSEGK